jgi:hypothetical protein
MLRSAGFAQVEELDFTSEFATVAKDWIEHSDRNWDRLAAVMGTESLEERQRDRRAQLDAVEDGLLRRSLYTAVRAAGRGRRPRPRR